MRPTSFNDLPRFTPSGIPSSLPVDIALRCPQDGGTFRSKKVGDPCPSCRTPSISADEPFTPRTPIAVPTTLIDDPIIAKLLASDQALPAEIRTLEARQKELRDRRPAASEAIAALRVRVQIGTEKQATLDDAMEALVDIDNALDRVDDELKAKRATSRAIREEIEKRAALLRGKIKPSLMAVAQTFRDEMDRKTAEMERLIVDAQEQARRFEPVFMKDHLMNGMPLFYDEDAATALGLLKHWTRNRTGKPRTILQMFTEWRRHSARL